METMRGCPYSCHYCYYHKDFKKLNYFSLERVERELKYILEREPRGVYLMDPTFNTNKKRSKEILRIIIKHNKKSTLHVELKAELLDEEMVDLLHKAGTDYIEIGIQSTNEKTLKLINRNFEPDKFRENVLLLNKKNLPYEIQLIDGLPADNYETLKNSVDWDYFSAAADDFLKCPDLHDLKAFAVRLDDDSMEPKFHKGDIVVFSPSTDVKSGDDCFICFAPARKTTFKRVFFEDNNMTRLQPRNEKYPPVIVRAEQVTGLFRAVVKYEKL